MQSLNLKRSIFFFCLFGFLICNLFLSHIPSSRGYDAFENNDDPAHATILTKGCHTNLDIDASSDRDFYNISLAQFESLQIIIWNITPAGIGFWVYHPNGTSFFNSVTMTTTPQVWSITRAPTAGYYMIEIFADAYTKYCLNLTDCGDDYLEENDSPATARDISQDTLYDQLSLHDKDYYNVSLGVGDNLTIVITRGGGYNYFQILLYVPGFTSYWDYLNMDFIYPNTTKYLFLTNAEITGDYTILCAYGVSADCNYSLFVTDLKDDVYENNDNFGNATLLTKDSYAGLALIDADYYHVHLNAGENLSVFVNFTIPPYYYSPADLILFDLDNTTVIDIASNVWSTGVVFTEGVDVEGDYTIQINPSSGCIGNYTMEISDLNLYYIPFTFSSGVAFNSTDWITSPSPYVNDTQTSIRIRLEDFLHNRWMTDATIMTANWTPGALPVSNEGNGYYRVYLNTTGLNASIWGYPLQLNVTSPFFSYLPTLINITVTVNPLPSRIILPQSTISVWENESINIGASFENTYHSTWISGANLTWKVWGGAQVGLFSPFLFVYEAKIDTLAEKIVPGSYTIEVTGQKENIETVTANFTLIVSPKIRTTLIFDTSRVPKPIIEGSPIHLQAKLSYEENSTPIQGVELTFTFNIFSSSGMTTIKLISQTSVEGLATVEFIVPSGATGLETYVMYANQTTVAGCISSAVTFQVISLLLQWAPYILLIIALILLFSLVSRKRHHSREVDWQITTDRLNDVTNILHLLVIHKESGTSMLSMPLGTTGLDGDLVSGFLQALTSFQSEIAVHKAKTSTGGTDNKSFTLSYADFKILLEDGQYIRAALMLEHEASPSLRTNLKAFITQFETSFSKVLTNWSGNLRAVAGAENIVERVFERSLLSPHVVNQGMLKKSLSKNERIILELGKAMLKDNPFFFLAKLLEYAIAGQASKRNEMWSAIYSLKCYHIIEATNIENVSNTKVV